MYSIEWDEYLKLPDTDKLKKIDLERSIAKEIQAHIYKNEKLTYMIYSPIADKIFSKHFIPDSRTHG